jgi:hypothetical protein
MDVNIEHDHTNGVHSHVHNALVIHSFIVKL